MATKGIWISAEIMQDKNLTFTEKYILAEIEQLSSLEDGCYAHNKHFADLTGTTTRTVSRAIAELTTKGYISVVTKLGTRNHVREMSTLDKMSNPPRQNVQTPTTKCLETKENKHINKHINKQTSALEMYVPLEGLQVANHLLTKIRSNKPNFKQPNIKSWAKEIDKAIRLDNRTVAELTGCIDWIYSDQGSFWIPNILSANKLREKFDTMESQMMTSKQKNDNGLDALLEVYNAS